ncbi:MAG: hypothetical protein JNK58_06160 [Phycisphaerae bacterium]|nr:hypothetical protein [Phycisphaerae bacterium]
MMRAGVVLVLLSVGVFAPGCSSGPRPGPRVVASGGSCVFEPVAIVVHPLSRLVMAEGKEPRIDAHIELRDAAGDEVKGVGRLVLELFRGSGPFMGGGSRQQVLRWETDLSDLAENDRSFDRVTRTYRFELTGLPATVDEKSGLRLRAELTTEDGREMTDEIGLER